MGTIFDKHAGMMARIQRAMEIGRNPVGLQFDEILSPTRGVADGREVLLVGTNNYLGLTFDPDCVSAAKGAIERHGTGTTGSRQANGNYVEHVELEQSISRFLGMASTIVFSTGYQTNLAAISGLAGDGDQIFIDADSHACIYDACRLSTATTIRFRHNNPADLDKRLSRAEDTGGSKLVVVEGMYSMFGDLAPLDEFTEVAHRHGAYIYVDEAHSFGCFGPTGRGLAEEQGVLDKIDFYAGTFSKSLASIGGFCSSKHAMFELVRAARPYMFTASPSPSNIASAQAALDAIVCRKSLHQNLWDRARQLHGGLVGMGFDVAAPDASPVIAVKRPDEETAIHDWNTLFNQGVYVNLAVPPATPAATSLLRLSVSAAHTEEEIDEVLAAFQVVVDARHNQTGKAVVGG
ncbi:MAG: aminotransferase class I/II-fold pyridoxal phosphate-dependent enzyme [Pseudomonadota bacterium]